MFWLGLNNLNTRHAERVEGCGSPVETSARSAEAPTEPAGETKSFCPCQKETVTVLVTVSFLLDKTCPRHARAGLRRRALPVADSARRGWRSGQNMAYHRHILGTARGFAKQLQVRLYTISNLVGITIAFVLRRLGFFQSKFILISSYQ